MTVNCELDDLCEESGDESDEAGEGDLTRFLIVGVLVIVGNFYHDLFADVSMNCSKAQLLIASVFLEHFSLNR